MPMKKLKKQSKEALLSEVKKEMAQPRAGQTMIKKAALRPARDRQRKRTREIVGSLS
jgi:hypothetical protein